MQRAPHDNLAPTLNRVSTTETTGNLDHWYVACPLDQSLPTLAPPLPVRRETLLDGRGLLVAHPGAARAQRTQARVRAVRAAFLG